MSGTTFCIRVRPWFLLEIRSRFAICVLRGIRLFPANVHSSSDVFLLYTLTDTTAGLAEYSHRIIRLSDDLVQCIRDYVSKPVKVNDVMSWFSFDAMGEITFGEDFGMMANRKAKGELIHQRQALALLAPLNDASWIAHLGFSLFPFLEAVRGWWAAVHFCCGRMEKRMAVRFPLNQPDVLSSKYKLTPLS